MGNKRLRKPTFAVALASAAAIVASVFLPWVIVDWSDAPRSAYTGAGLVTGEGHAIDRLYRTGSWLAGSYDCCRDDRQAPIGGPGVALVCGVLVALGATVAVGTRRAARYPRAQVFATSVWLFAALVGIANSASNMFQYRDADYQPGLWLWLLASVVATTAACVALSSVGRSRTKPHVATYLALIAVMVVAAGVSMAGLLILAGGLFWDLSTLDLFLVIEIPATGGALSAAAVLAAVGLSVSSATSPGSTPTTTWS